MPNKSWPYARPKRLLLLATYHFLIKRFLDGLAADSATRLRPDGHITIRGLIGTWALGNERNFLTSRKHFGIMFTPPNPVQPAFRRYRM
jgi:hypothetical protein